MSKPVWHKGPPPSVGWWPASIARNSGLYRWWNGQWWSDHAGKHNSAEDAALFASIRERDQHLVEWTDRPDNWPERSKT